MFKDKSTLIKRIVPVIIVLAVILFVDFSGRKHSLPVDEILRSSVLVESGTDWGSGNIWSMDSDSITVITAAHVIVDETDITVRFPGEDGAAATLSGGKAHPATLISSDLDRDYCFLRLDTEETGISVRPSTKDLKTGSDVFMLMPASSDSADQGTAPGISAGVIINPELYSEDFSQNVVYCNIEVMEGMSGGGLFDIDGNYLGLLIGGSDAGEGVFLASKYIE